MPFENHGSRSFTAISVDKNAPAASGVYGLSSASQWVYIGEAADIHAELLAHLRHPGELLRTYAPSGFTFELSPAGQRAARQIQLVQELEPIGNL
ncbi:conserved hypothetical protein [Candidatus Sulfopaludibacter sp. SbA3]|nr:conserved hypothetical protein [Candidatus Sulfopaludibacter sp. SbA3]